MKIVLTNFQIHKKLSITLTDGFNCLTGANNRGKSSVIRAIYWFLTNSPAGDWMCRRDASGNKHTTIVKFILDNGDVLKRVKGKGKNYYALNEQEYNDIGRNIPVEIMDALQMNSASIKGLGLNLNIEMQDELPFLVNEPSTVKSGALNVLTGVDTIEKTIKEYNKDRMAESREINYLESEVEIQVDALAKYDDLELISFEKCDGITIKIIETRGLISRLKELQVKYNDRLETVKRYEYLKDMAKDFLEIERLIVDVSVGRSDLEWLKDKATRTANYRKFREPPPFDFAKLAGSLDGLAALQGDLACLRTNKQRLADVLADMDRYKAAMWEASVKLKGMVCPTCGNRIKKYG